MRFLPREEKFFELFLDQVKLISEAASLLTEGLKTGNSTLQQAAVSITELERKADLVLREVFKRLGETFITPLDPEDIHSLATRLDDIIDGIEDLAHRMVVYRIEPVPPVAIQVTEDIGKCVNALRLGFMALRDGGKVMNYCIEISAIEEDVDTTIRRAIGEMFDGEQDPIRIIKLKEVYDLLEETTDFCDDVSVALQNVVLKNS